MFSSVGRFKPRPASIAVVAAIVLTAIYWGNLFRFSPSMIDRTYDDTSEASVVGRPHPEWGEEVVAFVVARDGKPPMPGELDRLCLDNIARFKRPKDYKFVDALPKNNYGKILKTELRTML